jgi:hypothetical protein
MVHLWQLFMADTWNTFNNNSDAAGRRVRLRPKPDAISQIYGEGGILTPLRATNGMVFPYQPTITYQQDVNYTAIDMVHTNQEFYAYTRTNALKMNVSGQFTVQNQTEGVYSLACIHFLRTVTKMYFGQGARVGTPPPVLLFDAYGTYMFNQLPVIVTNFSVGLPNDVDYVAVDLANVGMPNTSGATGNFYKDLSSLVSRNPELSAASKAQNLMYNTTALQRKSLTSSAGYVWLPAVFTIEVSITVQNTPSRLRQFNLDQFRTGALLKGGKWI